MAYFDMPTLSPGTSTPQAPAVIPAPSDATAPLCAHPQRRGTQAAAAAAGGHPDTRDAQIARLKAGNAALKTRYAEQDQAITALQDLRTLTLSRLAAQHDEIQRLRAAARTGNVRALPPAPMDSPGTADLRGEHPAARHRPAPPTPRP